jgi:flagellin-like protein
MKKSGDLIIDNSSDKREEERGVQPVVGVILLVALTVALATIVGVLVFGFGVPSDSGGSTAVSVSQTGQGTYFVQAIKFEGPGTVRVSAGGDSVTLTSVGDSATVSLQQGDSLTVVSVAGGSEQVINTVSQSDTGAGSTSVSSDSGTVSYSEPSSTAPESSNYSTILSNMDGDGTESNPYVITNDIELQAMGEENAYYVLGNNIDASKTDQWNNGDGFNPINFGGNFDGKQYKIKGIYISSSARNTGLFGVNGGYVGNFSHINFDITSPANNIGGVVGKNQGTIEKVYANGSVGESGTSSNSVGLIVGTNVDFSSVNATHAEGSVQGDEYVGGIAGNTDEAVINNSYAEVNITANNVVGGISGRVGGKGDVTFSYSDSEIDQGAGVAAAGNTKPSYEGTYWLKDTYKEHGQGDIAAIKSVFENDFTRDDAFGSSAESTLSKLDFENIWTTVSGESPRLKWEE